MHKYEVKTIEPLSLLTGLSHSKDKNNTRLLCWLI